MRNIRLVQGLCSTLLWLSTTSLAGIAIDTTRVIFTANDNTRGVSVGVTSSSQSLTPYLVKAQVLNNPFGDKGETPFLVSPSLFRLEPGTTNQVRVMKKATVLPQDKESVFYLRTVAIPTSENNLEQPQNNIGGTVQVSTGNIIKLFYRPNNLGMTQQQATKLLKFTRANGGVKVSNPTPYYITLTGLKIGDKNVPLSVKLNNNMIAPFSDYTYHQVPQQGAVEWISINDYGGAEVSHGQVQ
ncbi:molecular chaperone [Providencia stuartii]|uniref:fimbrial biogenesis chaperone n=1 Tax=Providencia stuartii TaxID=588 RepID=UPI0023ED74FF|nr:molecular chaperone [Providencia thailandensis]MDF4176411.1 molecular chaperone [Providencia thailandensis]